MESTYRLASLLMRHIHEEWNESAGAPCRCDIARRDRSAIGSVYSPAIANRRMPIVSAFIGDLNA